MNTIDNQIFNIKQMKKKLSKSFYLLILILLAGITKTNGQENDPALLSINRLYNSNEFRQEWLGQTEWFNDGEFYTKIEWSKKNNGVEIALYETKTGKRTILVSTKQLTPKGQEKALTIASYSWSKDRRKLLIFTNTKRVWRSNTQGDYWYLNLDSGELKQLGGTLPESSLMFAKFSPNNEYVAYVSGFNIYTEHLTNGKIIQLTKDGNKDIINGTFDWVYEEEFSCRDGFRWSPDGNSIAFWQLDASKIKSFNMINNTDGIYSQIIPVQYPKVGEDPSKCQVGVVNVSEQEITWMDIPGDKVQNYLPRMEWIDNEVFVQQINRKQNQLNFWLCNPSSGKVTKIHTENEKTWIDIRPVKVISNKKSKSILHLSEKGGWRHLYAIDITSKKETLLSTGDYDIDKISLIDEKGKVVYFIASPENTTQRYLYKIPINGSKKLERVSPAELTGYHNYNISPNGKYAIHSYSNANTPSVTNLITLPNHKIVRPLIENKEYTKKIASLKLPKTEYSKIKTTDGIEMEVKIIKPLDFDLNKKYPVLFHVYGEPWSQTTLDSWRLHWHHMLAQMGYLIVSVDNRGTPCLKGREWRKSIYRKIGVLNSHDQAMAAQEILKWNFVDEERVAVWGWSGGGSMTLNLMFRYPEIYKTGMSVAPVANQLYYDNIYQERYMGLPSENMEDFVEGSPITYAKNLKGNLLLVHGTGDDNVHYQNAEALINELIKHNKQFQVMPYPNRSHGIYEGENTTRHLYTLLTNYLTRNIKPGAK